MFQREALRMKFLVLRNKETYQNVTYRDAMPRIEQNLKLQSAEFVYLHSLARNITTLFA